MKLILAYELPFIIAIFTPVLKVGSILISDIIKYQAATSALIFSPSCFLAFFVALLCCQAKLAFSPFDIPEAEQEIMGGPLVEYSGPLLAVFKLTKAMLLFILPTFLITLFMSGGNVMSIFGPIIFIIKYLFVLLLIILIKNTNPRLRIDQALKFFWVGAGGLAVISLILAYMGA
jgi:NADH-quinone oxidoreductase subunit H